MRRHALRVRCCFVCTFVAFLGLAVTVPASAHESDSAKPGAAMTGIADGFQKDVAADLERTGAKLVSLAEAIPADKYGWRPAEGVRSVSEVFVHVANANTMMPAPMGMTPPAGVDLPADMPAAMAWMQEQEASITDKDAVIAALKSSIDYAAGAVRGLASSTLEDEINMFGFPASRRAYVLVLLTHNHEHLGQAIAYARSIGVVPPWSAAETAAEEAAMADDPATADEAAGEPDPKHD